jgi:hypothetical protein
VARPECVPNAHGASIGFHCNRESENVMNARLIRTSIALIAFAFFAAAFAQAEPSSVEIKFKFIVGGKIMDAGNYAVDVADGGKVVLKAEKGGTVELSSVKDLGRRKVSKAELVFDEAGSMMYLSEVWVPEKDGIKVGGADGAERRVTVSSKVKK